MLRSSYANLNTPASSPPSGIFKHTDIIIAVVGVTGSGKSTFVGQCSGIDVIVDHGLNSCTKQVEVVTFQHNGRTIHLVDTPGFDDSAASDVDVLEEIAYFLAKMYRSAPKLLLSGVIYLHPIHMNRMTGTATKDLRLFNKLVGADALHSVVMATTMWNSVTEALGAMMARATKAAVANTTLTTTTSMSTALNGQRVVMVLGPTGAGKSSLLKDLSGDGRITVGHGLNSETPEIKSWPMTYNGITYALVDTPGFDDSYRSNQEIVEEILQWLAKEYRNNIELATVIYVHSIMNPRMQGVARQNLRMFQKLVGVDGMRNVILATSFWDQVDLAKGQERELALKTSSEFFGSMINKGATCVRLEGRDQNLRLLDQISNFPTVVLQCQKEMVDQGISFGQTAAAKTTIVDTAAIEAEKRKHQEEMNAIRKRAERQAVEQKKAREREKRRVEAELARQRQLAEQQRLRKQQIHDAQVERQRREREAEASRLRQIQQQQIEQQRFYDQQVQQLRASQQQPDALGNSNCY